MNRRESLPLIAVLAAAPLQACSSSSPTEPVDKPSRYTGEARSDTTVWQAINADGWSPRPHPRYSDYIYALDGVAAPDNWGWFIEIDGKPFFDRTAATKSISKGSKWSCALVERRG